MPELILAALAVALATTAYFGDFEKYSIATFGVFRRVSRRSVREQGHDCADCSADIKVGEHRRWYKEMVAFGVPIFKYDGGTRRYCRTHADLSVQSDLRPVVDFQTPNAPADFGEESPFGDTVQTATTAVELIPVAIVVLFAASIMRLFHWAGPE